MTDSDYAYENVRRVVYPDDYIGNATFVPVCPNCGRFVKADATVATNEIRGLVSETTATCSKCGRVAMPFEGSM